MPNGFRYSSLSTSPGCTGRIPFLKAITRSLLVVIRDFYVCWSRFGPHETNAPLIVNPDAVLSCPISNQRFKAISRWRLQVFKHRRGFEHFELSGSSSTYASKPLRPVGLEELPCLGALEALYRHKRSLYRLPVNGNRSPRAVLVMCLRSAASCGRKATC